VVLTAARRLATYIVVDCGFCLEMDEENLLRHRRPRRNGATHAVLAAADVILAVNSAEPVGLRPFRARLAELREIVPTAEPGWSSTGCAARRSAATRAGRSPGRWSDTSAWNRSP